MVIKKIIAPLLSTFLLTGIVSTTAVAKPQQKHKPFLIQHKLPHLTKKIKMLWDDQELALTSEQKKELLKVRKETLIGVKKLAKKIFPLENEITKAAKKGAKPQTLEEKVKKLADLRAQATMVHLNCIYKTKQILTPHQLKILKQK
ncbi:MAG: hypothetical protein GXO11_00030 [Epsilonproteobacteria bacterium]|nr:hypothetical protein [Campylobacterota bacterium]